nr:hypothetical protein [Tanacetum cinerariifolium]
MLSRISFHVLYSRLEEEKAHRHGKVYNWENTKYDKIWMLLNLIKNLYMPLGIPFDHKRCYKDGVYTRMLRRPRSSYGVSYLNMLYLLSEQKASSYTSIRDLMLRSCHKIIACSIAGSSQTPNKVIVTDLFYLRGMDVRSVNIPYLLARLQGLTVTVRDLPVIDMDELVRLQICKELDDTWDWVALGPERQPDVMVGALEIDEGAPHVDEGGQAILAPAQAPQPPPVAKPAQTMALRLVRMEEDVHEIRGALGEQREVMDVMAKDLSKFTVCAARGISKLLDSTRATY